MLVVFLRFAENRSDAPGLEAHDAWLKRGFEDGAFLESGSLRPGAGDAILAHVITSHDLRARVERDPFVAEGVVRAELREIAVTRTDPRPGVIVDAA